MRSYHYLATHGRLKEGEGLGFQILGLINWGEEIVELSPEVIRGRLNHWPVARLATTGAGGRPHQGKQDPGDR